MDCQKEKGKYKPSVTSVCFGALASLKQLLNQEEFVKSYKEVIIVFDNDEGGQNGVRDVAFHLPSVKSVTLSHKDPCEVVQVLSSRDLYSQLMFGAKDYQPDDVITGALSDDELFTPLKAGVKLDILPKLSHKLQGLREREATFILAPSGVGKTTVCRWIGLELMEAGKKIDWVMLEEDPRKTQQALIAMRNKIPAKKFRQNPSIISKEQQQKDKKWIEDSGCVWVNSENTFGKMTAERLQQRLKWARVQGCEYAIIDHLTMLIYGAQGVADIDECVTNIAAIVNATGIHPIIVSHIKRTNKPAPKNKQGEIEYPYWVPVTKEDARGSSSIEQLGWNILVLEPEILNAEGDRGRVRIRVEKNREWLARDG